MPALFLGRTRLSGHRRGSPPHTAGPKFTRKKSSFDGMTAVAKQKKNYGRKEKQTFEDDKIWNQPPCYG